MAAALQIVIFQPLSTAFQEGGTPSILNSENASGSTSQAANIAEAIEAGTKLLLIDEDTSATNFMIRDQLMQQLIHREQEPITPFVELVRPIYQQRGVSTILVVGSSGTYFHVADTVVQMDCYQLKEITAQARKVAGEALQIIYA